MPTVYKTKRNLNNREYQRKLVSMIYPNNKPELARNHTHLPHACSIERMLSIILLLLVFIYCSHYLINDSNIFHSFLFVRYDIPFRIQYLGNNYYSLVKSHQKYSPRFLIANQHWHNFYPSQVNKFVSKDPLWNYSDPFPYLSIYNNRVKVCTNQTFLLMMIPSKAIDMSVRTVIRNLYPQNMSCHKLTINRIFLIAIEFVDRELILSLKNEAFIYKDIILVNSPEGNIHLSKITWGGYYWATQFCDRVKYVGKFDTDEIIHIDKLIHKLMFLPTFGVYAGHKWKDVEILPITKPYQKWVFPNDYSLIGSRFSYVSGVAEIYSNDVIPLLAVGAYYQDLFMTAGEDFMSGIILSKIGIYPLHIQGLISIQKTYSNKVKGNVLWHSLLLKDLSNLKRYSLSFSNTSKCAK